MGACFPADLEGPVLPREEMKVTLEAKADSGAGSRRQPV